MILARLRQEENAYSPILVIPLPIIILLIVALAFVAYSINLFGIRSLIEESNMFNRLNSEDYVDLHEDSRFDIKLLYLQHFVEYPFGGGHLQNMYGYAHDIFLDTFDMYGIVALAIIALFIVFSFAQFLRFVRNKKHSFDLRRIILCIYISAYVIFLVEPIQGIPWVFSSFCIVHGAISALQKSAD